MSATMTQLLSRGQFCKLRYDTIPVKSASANVSFYTSNSKTPNFEIDERYQLDATIVIYYHKLSPHVSGIYMPIFRSTGYVLLHMGFSTVKEN
jgi:hypothetical protein